MVDLLTDFETVDASAWKARLEKDLKGVTFEQLQQPDDNGLTIFPFYTKDDEKLTGALFAHKDWTIVERIVVKDEITDNKHALQALRSGASGLYFQIEKEQCDWEILFNRIELDHIQTFIGWGNADQYGTLMRYLADAGVDKNVVHSGTDSIASYFSTKEKKFKDNIGQPVTDDIFIDGSLYYNAGANTVSQLAYTIAHLQETLHNMRYTGSAGASSIIRVNVAVGTAFFEEIAKLRALRRSVALLLKQYDIEVPVHIYVITGSLYKAAADAYSNLLRDSIAGMAAVMGGCNALCILPFDESAPKGNAGFSQRMAINQQLLMKEESYFDQVADVANGSFYIERLTGQFAEAAWEHFKRIEVAGGILEFFEAGQLTAEITMQAGKLVDDLKSGKKTWIGMNKYPNANDMPKAEELPERIDGAINPLKVAAFLNGL